MSLTVADLLAKLSLDTSGFRKGAEEASAVSKKVEESASKAGQATEGAGQSATKGGKSFGDLSKSLNDTTQKFTELLTPANLFGTVIGVAVVGALHNAIAATKDYALEMQRLQLVAGGTMGQLGELQDAASKTGIGTDKLKRAFFFLSSEIESGGRNLAKFGISTRDSTGAQRESLEIFSLVGEKFRAMTNETERAVAARKLFTRGGADMLSLFELEAKQIKELGESGRLFAEQFGKEGAKGMILFGGAISEVDEALTRMKIAIITDIAPGLKILADYTASAIDLLWKIPPPIRLLIETIATAGIAFVALKIAMVALGPVIAAARLAMVAFGVSTGVALSPVALIAAGLAALLILGPPLASVIASLLPQSVIDAWKSFAGWVSKTWIALKGYIGMAEAVKPPETQNADREKTAAEMQIELALNQRLWQAQIALAKATQETTQYEIAASLTRQHAATAEIDIELKKLSAEQNADQQIKEERAQLESAKTNIMAAGVAERNRLHAQEKIILLDFDAEMEKLQISRTQTGEDAARNLAVVEQNAAFKRLKELQSNNAALLSDQRAYDKAVLDSQVKLDHAITQIERERIAARIDYATKQNDIVTAQAQFQRDHVLSGLEEEKKVLQDRFDTYTISQTQLTDSLIQIAEREKTAKMAFISEEVKGAIAAAALQRQKVEEQSAAGPTDEVKKANEIKAINLNLYAELVKIGNREVEAEEGFTNKKLELLRQEAKQAGILFAQEAGQIDDLKRKREQSIQNLGTVLENQARLAGDLDAAYQVGFAHAATAADDAFAAMRKAGADTYTSLKSGASDFLYEITSTSGKIGDVMTNLGKRILRTMTDAFAEIAVKWAVTAAGFSLPSLLGTGVAVAGAAGMEGAPNAAAQAVTGLGNAATESTAALNSMTGVLGLVMRVLTMFGNGLMGIFNFFSQIVQGIASGGGVINTITSVFGGLVKSGGALYGIFNGLSNVGSAIVSVFTEGASLANVFQTAFNALGLSSGGFGAVELGAPGVGSMVEVSGQFATFLGQWVPIAGALYMAAMAIQNFFSGDAAVKIGTGIGLILAGPFGGYIGGIIGGMFSPQPKVKLSASITPFDRTAIGADVIGAGGLPGTQVGAGLVNISGNIMKNSKERELQLALAGAINHLLVQVVDATVQMIKTLPPTIGAQLDAALTDLEAHGLTIDVWSHTGKKAAKRFKQHVEALMGDTLQALTVALDFGDVDLKALGFDPKDPKGKKGGEIVRGFEAMMTALGAMSSLVKITGDNVAVAGVSLAQFTAHSIALFKGYQQEGEIFTDTIKRVMTATSAASSILDAYGIKLKTNDITVEAFVQRSLEFFQKYAKEGEKFTDTVQRVGTAMLGIAGLMDTIDAQISASAGDMGVAFDQVQRQIDRATANIATMADRLSVAIASSAQPDEILALAKQLTDAVVQRYQTEIQFVQTLATEFEKLKLSSEQFILKLQTGIVSLQQGTANALAGIGEIIAVAPALISKLSLQSQLSLLPGFVEALRAGGGQAGRQELIGYGAGLFERIQQEKNPKQALTDLQALGDAVNQFLAAEIAALNDETNRQIAALTTVANARLAELEAEKQAIQDTGQAIQDQITAIQDTGAARLAPLQEEQSLLQAQLQTLQQQAQAAQAWQSIVQTVAKQLLDMQLTLSNPQNALERLGIAQGVVAQAKAAFAANATPETAGALQAALSDELKVAQEAFQRPSSAYRQIFDQVTADLRAIQSAASAQTGDLTSLTQEIADRQARIEGLNKQIADIQHQVEADVKPLQTQLAALQASNQAKLSAIATEEQAVRNTLQTQIAGLQAAQTEQIKAFQTEAVGWLTAIRNEALVRLEQATTEGDAELAKLLGDHTLEEFIALKNQEQVTALNQIHDLLEEFVSQQIFNSPVSPARIQEAVSGLRTLSELAQGAGVSNLAQSLAQASRSAGAGDAAATATSLSSASQIMNANPWFHSGAGADIFRQFNDMLSLVQQGQFVAAIRGVTDLVRTVESAGIVTLAPVPGYAEGTDYVPATGPALLHRGERVMTASENAAYTRGSSQGATVNISFTYAGSARRDEWDRFLETVIEDARFGKLGKVISEKAKGA